MRLIFAGTISGRRSAAVRMAHLETEGRGIDVACGAAAGRRI